MPETIRHGIMGATLQAPPPLAQQASRAAVMMIGNIGNHHHIPKIQISALRIAGLNNFGELPLSYGFIEQKKVWQTIPGTQITFRSQDSTTIGERYLLGYLPANPVTVFDLADRWREIGTYNGMLDLPLFGMTLPNRNIHFYIKIHHLDPNSYADVLTFLNVTVVPR